MAKPYSEECLITLDPVGYECGGGVGIGTAGDTTLEQSGR